MAHRAVAGGASCEGRASRRVTPRNSCYQDAHDRRGTTDWSCFGVSARTRSSHTEDTSSRFKDDSEARGASADPHRRLLRLETNDINAEVARMKTAGVAFIEEPADQGMGFWLATCKNPVGNLVQLNYRAPDAREPLRSMAARTS